MKRGERGQTLVLFVGVITVIFVMAAVVIDVGLWLAERRSAQRAADLAAAAGAQDLLVSDSDAVAAAYDWAEKNGYDASDVNVELLCYNDSSSSAICDNPNPSAGPQEGCTLNCDSLRVTITKPSTMLFSSIFEIPAFNVSASSSAGLTITDVPTDTVILLDATGSMASGCTSQSDPTCPMAIARSAANEFVDVLLGGLNTSSKVAYAPYNFCYNPPYGNYQCIKGTGPTPVPSPTPDYPVNLVSLTSAAAPLHASINTTTARGGTNVCLGLDKALELITGAGAQPNARRNVVLLTDGEGNFSYDLSGPYPPAQCRPPSNLPQCPPAPQPCPNPPQGCWLTSAPEADLELKTYQRAQALKAQSVEIYVVSTSLCGNNSQPQSVSYCAGVGNSDPDSVADQRLLKCIASSPSHYLKISTASDIPDAFREIAGAIISRGLLE